MAKTNKTKRGALPRGVRLLFATVKLLIFPILVFFGIYIGLQVGYVRFGGGDPSDVLKWETYKHMLDLVFADQ